jgi:hypothetical protein
VSSRLEAVVLPQFRPDVPLESRSLGPGDQAWGSPVEIGSMEEGLSCGAGVVAGARSDDAAVRGLGYDLSTGDGVALIEPPASIGYSRPYAIGPWIVLDDSRLGEQVDGDVVRRLRVRRASGAPDGWVEEVSPLEENIDPGGAMPLDGIGLLDTSGLVDGRIVLWRLPASLTT